jgi:8-oxo-dGTP pyrophosphatase MutT (NUDIX family)
MSLPMKSGRDAIIDELASPSGEVNRYHASALDHVWQFAYAVAYRLLLLSWFMRRPTHHGALVALWHSGEILLLRNSYRTGWSLPGGGIGRGETARDAALRELREEVGLVVPPAALREAQTAEFDWEYRRDHTTIFEVIVAEAPSLRLDHREIVAAAFHRPDAIPLDEVAPHLARYLARFRKG